MAKNRLLITAIDSSSSILICAPLLILFFVLGSEGAALDIFKKPEWTFISTLFCIESFRDSGKIARASGIPEEQIESGYTLQALCLVISAIILIVDYRHSSGNPVINTETVYKVKFMWFGCCFLYFGVKRFKRHGLYCHE